MLAADLALKYIDNSIVVFIFMTDGCAGYPSNSIQKMKNLQANYQDKLFYAGIQFGGST